MFIFVTSCCSPHISTSQQKSSTECLIWCQSGCVRILPFDRLRGLCHSTVSFAPNVFTSRWSSRGNISTNIYISLEVKPINNHLLKYHGSTICFTCTLSQNVILIQEIWGKQCYEKKEHFLLASQEIYKT